MGINSSLQYPRFASFLLAGLLRTQAAGGYVREARYKLVGLPKADKDERENIPRTSIPPGYLSTNTQTNA